MARKVSDAHGSVTQRIKQETNIVSNVIMSELRTSAFKDE